MGFAPRGDAKNRLITALTQVIELRHRWMADRTLAPRVNAVKQWQAQRLRRSYADVLAQPRYRLACEFFLDELYGTRDFSQRDTEALRVVPMLTRLLPERAVLTLAMGCELDQLSEALDTRVAESLETAAVTEETYAAAYRAAGTRKEREWQIAQIVQIGQSLDKLARLPLISGMLHLMRGPAEAAGLSHLHEFLSKGFDSFRAMHGAADFLVLVQERETAQMNALLTQA